MSSINIKNFVDIKITTKPTTSIDSVRERTVLFTNDSTVTNSSSPSIFTSLKEVETKYNANYSEKLVYKYAKTYFEAGGVELKVILNTNLTAESLLPLVNELTDEEIIITVATTGGKSAEIVSELANQYNNQKNVYGVNQKIFLGAVNYTDFLSDSNKYAKANIDNFALKVGDLTNQIGCEMTIAAYLNKIDFYGINTVQDYAYTKEKLNVSGYPENINELVESVLDNDCNMTVEIANEVRNIGGNLTNGEDLVNKFTLIVLHQTLSQRVLNTLTQKLKGTAAITALYATISQELNKYVTNGYLTTDKIWSEEDLILKHNGKNYTLITQATALINGYKVTILPLNSLDEDDKNNHRSPLIYVILADGYAIRKVVINGEVI